jgi:hypothetical protein
MKHIYKKYTQEDENDKSIPDSPFIVHCYLCMKTISSFVVLFCLIQPLFAQNGFKFGDVPVEQLEMTVYEKDSTAAALVLYEDRDVYYDFKVNGFEIITNYMVRIKILTQEGIEYADGSIPFYTEKTRDLSETISNLTGFTYNLENGKVVKEKLSKNYIFTEEVSDNLKRMKFAMPAVKVGSVIEYKYKLASPYYSSPEDVQFQRSIPVQYSRFQIRIPEYFIFNREMKGYERLVFKSQSVNGSFLVNGDLIQHVAEEITVEVNDLPALKDEDFVWNYNDFKAGIRFELSKVQFVGSYYKDFSQTWGNIVKMLKEHPNFSKKFNNKSIFKEELPVALASQSNVTDSIRAILDLVRSKVKWNDKATLLVVNPQKALKEGVGTSGEINALLMTALNNAGFTSYPVVMSLRSRGRIPFTYPSIDNLNYFVVGVDVGDKNYYLDATLSYTDVNVIPIDCMVDKALRIYPNSFDWIDLSTIGNNTNQSFLNLSFNENGILMGDKKEIYSGEIAFAFKKEYNRAKDETDYVETQETKNDIRISDYKVEESRKNNYNFMETYTFEKNDIQLGDNTVIALNPLLFKAMKSNAFKSEARKLPVEFPFPYEEKINITLTIPEGYTVDEIPKPERIVFDDQIDFSYLIQQNHDKVQLAVRFILKTSIIPVQEYNQLRDFWSKVFAKKNEFITLKKI